MVQAGVVEGEMKNVKWDSFWSSDIMGELNQRGYEVLDLRLGRVDKKVYT
jgi:hypothetical protein